MNTKELFEHASLDALGFLDDEERREFERAFITASPEIQAQIRREQLRYTDQDELLPSVEPPADLRTRVIQAVRDAMATPQDEPIGQIGLTNNTNIRLLRQAPFWRAACFALATSTAVLSFFVVNVNRQSTNIASMIQNNEFNERMMEDLSPRFTNVLFASDMERRSFVPTAPDSDGVLPEAQMFIDADHNSGYVMLRNLPEIQGEYTVRFVDDQGRVVADIPFVNTGGIIPVPVNRLGDGVNFENCEIASPRGQAGRNEVILRTADL